MRVIGFVLFFFSCSLWAAEDQHWSDMFSLRASAGLRATYFSIQDGGSKLATGPSLSTNFTYRMGNWQIGFYSAMMLGLVGDMEIHVQDSVVKGDFWTRSISYGPVVSYSWRTAEKSAWSIYGGPQFGLTTVFAFDRNDLEIEGGRFKKENNLQFEGRGFLLGIAFSKGDFWKKDYYYYEITYRYLEYYKGTVVDGSEWRETTVIEEQSIEELGSKEHSIAFNVGFVVF